MSEVASTRLWKLATPEGLKNIPGGAIITSDANDFLRTLSDEIADIVFLDPPFNLGKKYGSRSKKDDLLEESEYLHFITSVLSETVRILKPGGALFLYHLPQWALRLGSSLDRKLLFRHWIAVVMKNGFARGAYLYPAHYALLYFTKGDPNNFRRPKIPAPKCRKCGEFIKDYGGYIEYVEDGINLSDVWEDLSPVRHRSRKNRPANELPLELLRRVIQISGVKGGLIVDPFVGSGTSIIAAMEAGMHHLSCDRERSYCNAAIQRLEEYLNQ